MKTIAFLNIKGGAGKTATVISVSHMLAVQYNKKVLIIDMDPQGNTTARFSNINVAERLLRKIKGEITSIDNSISDLLLDKDMDIHSCIRNTVYRNLDIIPADLELWDAQDKIKADVQVPPQFRLRKHLKAVEQEYDYCIMDCGPSVSIANSNSLAACDEVYIPTTTDADSLEGVSYALDFVRNIKEYNDKLELAGCFFTRWKSNQKVSAAAQEIIEILLEDKILPFKMYDSALVVEGTYMNEPLLLSDRNKSLKKVTMSYLHFAEYIMSGDRKKFLEDFDEEKQVYLTAAQISFKKAKQSGELTELKNDMLKNGILKPVEVYKNGKQYVLKDGRKRMQVQEELIREGIWDKYRPIPVVVLGEKE